MIVDIQTRRLRTIGQLRAFVEGNEAVDFQPRDREEAYGFVRDTLDRFGYRHLGKHDKGVVLKFLVAATGVSLKQTERLVRQWRETGAVRDRRGGSRGRPFARRYTPVDIRLLADVDEAYGQMSGLATREVLRRQFEVFGDARFERLATISNGHVYNLRGSATYRAKRTVWTKTQGTAVAICLRQAPEPEGRPGHVRVDTVHQRRRCAPSPGRRGRRVGVPLRHRRGPLHVDHRDAAARLVRLGLPGTRRPAAPGPRHHGHTRHSTRLLPRLRADSATPRTRVSQRLPPDVALRGRAPRPPSAAPGIGAPEPPHFPSPFNSNTPILTPPHSPFSSPKIRFINYKIINHMLCVPFSPHVPPRGG